MSLSDMWMEAPVPGDRPERTRNELVPGPAAERATRIVCLGGGTGLPVVLRGLARKAQRASAPLDITAIVAMSDDGGSSGRLRKECGALPPGDVRNCLVALASGHGPLRDVFQFRFGGRRGLAGHAVGNLVIAALAEQRGDFIEAIRLSSELLQVRGRVLPSTTLPVQLVARMADNRLVVGESNITRALGRIRRVNLSPMAPKPSPGVLEAIAAADLITFGPGSLYSSVIPNLLVDGVADALCRSRALKVYISNIMTQPGETSGMSCADHLEALLEHAGPVLDVVLVNAARPESAQLDRYAKRGAVPVELDRERVVRLGVVPVEADLLKTGNRIRHDASKVSRCLVRLARQAIARRSVQ